LVVILYPPSDGHSSTTCLTYDPDNDMAARHRARFASIQVMDVKEIEAKNTRRANLKQFHNSTIKFPLVHRVLRPALPRFRKTFKASRPHTYF